MVIAAISPGDTTRTTANIINAITILICVFVRMERTPSQLVIQSVRTDEK